MKQTKILIISALVAAALCLCVLAGTVIYLQRQLDTALLNLSDAESHVDSCIAEAEEMCEANTSLQNLNDELQTENDRLRKALDAYDYDFEVAAPQPPRYLDIPLDKDLQDYIWALCCDYDIEEHYELIYAMIYRESGFRSDAKSSSSWGLMQINKCNHERLNKKLGVTDFLDPYQNVHAGIYIIANLLHKHSVADALMAYNMGSGGAAKLWRQGVHSTGYTKRVLATYEQYKKDI